MGTDIARLLSIWQYAEYSALRIIAGWGRSAGEWDDKRAMCYHVWLQADIVDRLRCRLEMFPGAARKGTEAPVHRAFEEACNTLLHAPSFCDAMHGVHELLGSTLTAAYRDYLAATHPVHDLPTQDLLHEVLELKEKQAQWYRGFRARHAFTPDAHYVAAVRAQLVRAGEWKRALEPVEPFAAPCGKNSGFRLSLAGGQLKDWDSAPLITPLIDVNFGSSVEARRLHFIIGYFWEMNLAEQQLSWIYSADFMPWQYIYEESRHMWDESRHGDSGRTRLHDFGLDIQDVRYPAHPSQTQSDMAPLSPRELYENFYGITQIAEQGYFKTKGFCFEDFRDGGDAASAEMMQFDIIDETSHTEYGRTWLPVMMERAGVLEDWKARGQQDRKNAGRASDIRVQNYRQILASGALTPEQEAEDFGLPHLYRALLDPKTQAHYEYLLEVLRKQCPLSNVQTAPLRPNLPM